MAGDQRGDQRRRAFRLLFIVPIVILVAWIVGGWGPGDGGGGDGGGDDAPAPLHSASPIIPPTPLIGGD